MNAKGIVSCVAVVLAMGSLAGCRRGATVVAADVRLLTPSAVAPTFEAVLAGDAGAGLRLAYADLRSRTLVLADVPLTGDPASGAHLVMDRISGGAETDEDLGSLAYTVIEGVEYLAYLDRPGDGGLTLKQLYRSPRDELWNLDRVDPPGRPLGFLSTEGGVRLLLHTADGIAAVGVSPKIRGEERQMVGGVAPRGRVSVVRRAAGDTAVLYDSSTGRMVLIGWTGARPWSIEMRPPDGGSFGSVYHARLDSSGAISLFYFDEKAQELLDLQDLEGDPGLVRVTRARDVTAVEARTDPGATSYVWADMTREASGRLVPTLSVIRAPGGMRRIGTSSMPFSSLRVFSTPGEILTLALGGGLYLYRLAVTAP